MLKKAVVLLLVLLLVGSSTVWAVNTMEEEPLSPEGLFFDTFFSIREAQLELAGSLAEKALMQNELAHQLVDAIMQENNPELLDELVAALEAAEASLVELLEQLAVEDDNDFEGDAGQVCAECGGEGCAACTPDVCAECSGEGCAACTPGVCEECGGVGCEACTPRVCEKCGGEGCEECVDETIGEGKKQRGWRLLEKINDETLPEHVRANALKALSNMVRTMEKQAWKNALKASWDRSAGGPPPWSNSIHNRDAGQGDNEEGNSALYGCGDKEESLVFQSQFQQDKPAGGKDNSCGAAKGKSSAPGQLKKKAK